MPHQIKGLMESLRGEIASLRDAINKGTESIADRQVAQQESQDKQLETVCHAIDAYADQQSQSQNASETNQDRRHRQNLRLQKLLVGVTALAFLAAAYYAYEAHSQLCTMNKTLSEVHLQTVAANKSLCIARKALKDSEEENLISERAWINPENVVLMSHVENGLPLRYKVRVVDVGKEAAEGVIWKFVPYGVPYIPETEEAMRRKLPRNSTCDGLRPDPKNGVVVYPGNAIKFFIPDDISDTPSHSKLLDVARSRKESIVIDGCVAYVTVGETHTSQFRVFLRDVNRPGYPPWEFNLMQNGNSAN